jgi:RimJ/RimL family protein N-acetyltransferase
VQDDEAFALLNDRITPTCAQRATTVVLSVRRAGKVIASVGFTEFMRDSVEMLCAALPGENWLHRGLIRESFRYAFVTARKPRVWSRVKSTNKAALAMNDGLGFVREGIQRCHFGSDDAVLFGMLRNECRWLHKDY